VLALTRPLVPDSHADLEHRRFDAVGAVSVTGGLALLVYAISKAPDVGWATGRTIGFLAAAVAALVFFVVWELRTRAPLVPFTIFRIRSLTAANVVGLLLGAVIFANFFMLTLYVQQVLGWSALRTGLTFLATAGTTVLWAGVSQALVTKVGPRLVATVGLAVLALTVLGYTRLPVDGSYWPDLLPLYLTFALGMAFAFIPVTVAAFIGVAPRQAGLASGLLNTSQQIGGAIGVAVTATIFTSRTTSLIGDGHPPQVAATSGFHWGFAALVVFAVLGALAALFLPPGAPQPAKEFEEAAVAA